MLIKYLEAFQPNVVRWYEEDKAIQYMSQEYHIISSIFYRYNKGYSISKLCNVHLE